MPNNQQADLQAPSDQQAVLLVSNDQQAAPIDEMTNRQLYKRQMNKHLIYHLPMDA